MALLRRGRRRAAALPLESTPNRGYEFRLAMTRVLLIRHGETSWNREQRWQGHADVPLCEEGYEQARRLASFLSDPRYDGGASPIRLVYSSDLLRASQTAEVLGRALGFDKRLEPDWREIDVGRWAGCRREEIRARFAEEWRRIADGEDLPRGGGETFGAFSARVVAALERVRRAHEHETVAVVTHGGVIRAALLHVLGLPWLRMREVAAVSNTAINELSWDGARWAVAGRNQTAHLAVLA
jgi:probable phosphoglycerate mutase